MSEEKDGKPSGGKSYQIGAVGPFARVAQGENISWIEGVSGLPDGESLAQQFFVLLKQIAENPDMDEDTRALAQAKTEAVAEGLAQAKHSPGTLRRALLDAKSWFSSKATWVGEQIGKILKSEAAQKTIATITEAGLQATIKSFTGGA
jgi:hypothetical protein